ncbi:MFS transporter [Oceanobacter sp. 3_MG-2023]|uniref:MFS transporter n=1 Tax=Oceanobacter sp. 3_MG-2023 TaxID=3062622 RepID=UPI0027349A23|nr:MFS transporter [Oceanobacter sp. 3_MG-2023]MDP2505965.1 MFS transporter [Oceanobacter sp. 3_MG-2023]
MSRLSSLGSYTLLCISCLTIMVGAVVAPGLASISMSLGVADHAGFLITLPALGAVLFAPFAGRLIDRFGAYPCTFVALFLYGALGVSGQWLSGPIAVYSNRIALGAMTTVVMAGSTTLISQFYVGHERLKMIARQGMAVEAGGVIFLFIGGLLAVQSWEFPFFIYLVAWLFLGMLFLFVPDTSAQPISLAESPESSGSGSRSLLWVYLSACMAMMIFFTVIVVLPLSMERSGYSADHIGLLLAFISFVAVITAHFLPRVNLRWKDKGTLSLAFVFYALAHLAFYVGASVSVLVLGGLLAGMGFGLSIPLLNHMTVERSDPGQRGKNLSYFAMAIFLGQFLTSFVELVSGHFLYLIAALVAALYGICVWVVFAQRSPAAPTAS